MRLHLAQAFSNRAPRGRKHDFKDAERLVRRLIANELILSFVPNGEQRIWRSMTRMKLQSGNTNRWVAHPGHSSSFGWKKIFVAFTALVLALFHCPTPVALISCALITSIVWEPPASRRRPASRPSVNNDGRILPYSHLCDRNHTSRCIRLLHLLSRKPNVRCVEPACS